MSTDVFTDHRPLLFSVAYRLTGSVADAEDVVQEAWLRWARTDADQVRAPKAYLVKTVTNLALNELQSARARRETYVGPWLPEPLLTSPDATEEVEMADSVSLAMLVVLESLSPLERAVFVLGEVFGYRQQEIAELIDRDPAAVRQLAHRAREHVQARRPRYPTDPATQADVVARFRDAAAGGDMAAMMELLAPDVTMWSDGGGKVTAARRPVVGADNVVRWLFGVMAKPQSQNVTMTVATINGEAALLATEGDAVIGAIMVEVNGAHVVGLRLMLNPDKLRGLTR
ncbi:MAG TPA: RNA polymerase sigma-70 factor [Micromonosporaceae bacterium]|jgi:RNA polymerase sigma-70 factor (ECF subfamily)|nr:RNA polymerase sigma-70 factor [Micromonosporaceae bacterium]